MERWAAVAGYEGLYEVSDHGRVRSFHHRPEGRVLRPGQNRTKEEESKGYLFVNLYKTNAAPKCVSVHRLVAQAFVTNPRNSEEVNHKDGQLKNNHFKNLEWVTRLENVQHACYVLGKQYKGLAVKATWPDGTERVFASQKAAELELLGKMTGIVSWALKSNGGRGLGLQWHRVAPSTSTSKPSAAPTS